MARENNALSAFILRWGFAAIWALLPFMAGPALATALELQDQLFQSVASLILWIAWAIVLSAAVVPRTTTLTVARIIAPASVIVTMWAAVAMDSPNLANGSALVASIIAASVVLLPAVGEHFVNGSSYGDEHRFPLRAPGMLLIGPIEIAWLVTLLGVTAGPLLLASRQLLIGAFALAIGWPAAWIAARSLHLLARRWLVFTPAGVVLHDPLSVVEAMLVLRNQVKSIGPADHDSAAKDLTQSSPGLALEIGMVDPLAISPTPVRHWRERGTVVSEDVTSVLFTPSRPGAVLRAAARRRFSRG